MARRAVELLNTDGSHGGWLVERPACGFGHLFDGRWTFNGNEEHPTFTPSMLVHDNPNIPDRKRCHSFVTDGRIQFLGDSGHALAGQTVELPEIP